MVERIRAVPDEVKLLVVDVDAETFYREHDIVVTGTLPNVVTIQTPAAVNPAGPQHDTGRPKHCAV